MDNQQPTPTVSTDLMLAVVEEQRNQALTAVAQWQALAIEVRAERDQLAAELEQLRGSASVS